MSLENCVRYLNLDMATFKELAIRQLEQGEFRLVRLHFRINLKTAAMVVLRSHTFDLKASLTGIWLIHQRRANAFEWCMISLMTHAMVLTGVNFVDGKPNCWKVENSWGEESGVEGFWYEWHDWWVYVPDRYQKNICLQKSNSTLQQRTNCVSPMGSDNRWPACKNTSPLIEPS